MSHRTATEFDKALGARVKKQRHAIGMTQGALGEAIGVTFQQVQKYETGVNRMSVETALDVADVLDVPFVKLVRGLRE